MSKTVFIVDLLGVIELLQLGLPVTHSASSAQPPSGDPTPSNSLSPAQDMSLQNRQWAQGQKLRPLFLHYLLVELADRCPDGGQLFISIQRLASELSCSDRWVRKGIRRLEWLGLIRDTGKRKGKTGQIRIYQLLTKNTTTSTSKTGRKAELEFRLKAGTRVPPLTPPHMYNEQKDLNSTPLTPPTPKGGGVEKQKPERPTTYVRECINRKYRRSDSAPWSYLEESMLVEVCLRPDVISEMKELWDFHDAMPLDRKRFFPQTVGALLEKWTGSLDIARANRPENKSLRSKEADRDSRDLANIRRMMDRLRQGGP